MVLYKQIIHNKCRYLISLYSEDRLFQIKTHSGDKQAVNWQTNAYPLKLLIEIQNEYATLNFDLYVELKLVPTSQFRKINSTFDTDI